MNTKMWESQTAYNLKAELWDTNLKSWSKSKHFFLWQKLASKKFPICIYICYNFIVVKINENLKKFN